MVNLRALFFYGSLLLISVYVYLSSTASTDLKYLEYSLKGMLASILWVIMTCYYALSDKMDEVLKHIKTGEVKKGRLSRSP